MRQVVHIASSIPGALRQDWRALASLAVVASILFTLRLMAPPNLLDQDQESPAAYVLDVVHNGHWICQHDLAGNITSKPPLYTWLAALVTLAYGRISIFTLYLPGALALLGEGCLVFHFGQIHFNRRAGLFGALACMLCTAGLKQFGLARTDGVFAFTVTAAAFLAYTAWTRGSGWIWFWLASAAATLTKGPLGLLLAALGLLAAAWERRSPERPGLRGPQLPGVIVYVTITAGWLALAWSQLGWSVIDKLFVQELVFHVVEGEQKMLPGTQFYLSPLYYLGRAAPWSLFASLGVWRILRRPAPSVDERRFERFLLCWFVGGLALFSVAPHQRGDLLWPIMPAGALLAGRELSRLIQPWDTRRVRRVAVAAVLFATMGFAFYYFGPRARAPYVQQTMVVRDLAQRIRQQPLIADRLQHVDDPAGLQIYLNTFRRPLSFDQAADLLRGPEPACLALTDLAGLEQARRPDDPPLYTAFQALGPVPKLSVLIVSNRPHW